MRHHGALALTGAAIAAIATSQPAWEAHGSDQTSVSLTSGDAQASFTVTVSANDEAVPDVDHSYELGIDVQIVDTGSTPAVVAVTVYEVDGGDRIEVNSDQWIGTTDETQGSFWVDASLVLADCDPSGCDRELEVDVVLSDGDSADVNLRAEATFTVYEEGDGVDGAQVDVSID
jgi:hypothetical protein